MTCHWHRRLAWTHLFPCPLHAFHLVDYSAVIWFPSDLAMDDLPCNALSDRFMEYPTFGIRNEIHLDPTRNSSSCLYYLILPSWWAIEKLKFKYYYTRLHSQMMNLSLKQRMQYRLWIEESSSQRVRRICQKRYQNRKGHLNRSEEVLGCSIPHLVITSIGPLRNNCPVRDDTSSRQFYERILQHEQWFWSRTISSTAYYLLS